MGGTRSPFLLLCFPTMSGDGEPSSDGKGGGGGGLAWRRPVQASRQTRHLSKFIAQDKENFFFFPGNNIVEPLQQRSPLPVGYPRVPLQDITAILSPLNVCSVSALFLDEDLWSSVFFLLGWGGFSSFVPSSCLLSQIGFIFPSETFFHNLQVYIRVSWFRICLSLIKLDR